jgi:hypothetical protein
MRKKELICSWNVVFVQHRTMKVLNKWLAGSVEQVALEVMKVKWQDWKALHLFERTEFCFTGTLLPEV